VIIVGATSNLVHIYLNMIKQGYWLFLIGTANDREGVLSAIKEAMREVEGMEYPEGESTMIGNNQEISKIHYFSLEQFDMK
jgi:hypothetical protein